MKTDDKKEIKRQQLYEAVITLMEKGDYESGIKMSDIAAESGVAKGTVYEYFSSREEIIARTIVYYFDKYLKKAERVFEMHTSLRDRIWGIFDIISKEAGRSEMFFDILFSTGKISDIYKLLKKADVSQNFDADARQYIGILIRDGVAEGVISPDVSPDYASFVIGGVMTSFIASQHKPDFSEDEKNMRREFAYTMLKKSLN